jgi:hypothetical protein
MKIVITPYQREEADYFCDKHPDRQCYSELKLYSWYGSKFDFTGIIIHLCDECVEEIKNFLMEKYNAKLVDFHGEQLQNYYE